MKKYNIINLKSLAQSINVANSLPISSSSLVTNYNSSLTVGCFLLPPFLQCRTLFNSRPDGIKLDNKLVINSTFDNLVFENDKAVLLLPPFKDFLYHIDEFKKDWLRFGFNKDMLISSDFYICLIKVLDKLEPGYYWFDWFFYFLDIDNNDKDVWRTYNYDDFNENHLILSCEKSGYNRFVSIDILLEKGFSSKKVSIGLCESIIVQFKMRLESGTIVNILDNEKSNLLDIIDFNQNTLLVINKANEEYERFIEQYTQIKNLSEIDTPTVQIRASMCFYNTKLTYLYKFHNQKLIKYFIHAYKIGKFDDLIKYLEGLTSEIGNNILDNIEQRKKDEINDIYFNVVYTEGLLKNPSDKTASVDYNVQNKFITLKHAVGKRFYSTNISNNIYSISANTKNSLNYYTVLVNNPLILYSSRINQRNNLKINSPSIIALTQNRISTKATYMVSGVIKDRVEVQENNDFNKTDYFSYLSKLTEILSNLNKTELEKQISIEKFLGDYVQSLIKQDEIFINKYKGYLHNFKGVSVKESLSEALKTYLLHDRKGILGKLLPKSEEDSLQLIIVSYSLIISYYNKLGYTAIAAVLGRMVMEILYLKEGQKIINNSNKKQKSKIKFDEYLKFKKVEVTTLLKIGDYFISLLSQFPHNIFERYYELSTKSNKELAKIQINTEFLDSVKNNIIINSANLPMVVEPLKWSLKKFGGYLKNQELKQGIVTKGADNKHITKVNKTLYDTVNILNSVKFSVNTLLLNYLLNEGKYILDEIKTKDDLQRTITLKIAESLSKSPFYLTVRSDWRGRLVTESFFLTYQGNDLSVGLVNFWEGEALTEQGLYYFKISGANNHNMDNISKKSYFDRVNWVNEYYDKIISLDRDLILSAENPFLFTTFCLNMQKINKDPNFIVKSPIFLDATCSGIQHLAGLLLDYELGVNVNLDKSNHFDTPRDLYSELLEPINKAINKYGDEQSSYSNLSLVKFDRKNIKQSIMTKVYNVSTFGISKQLKSKFEKVDEEFIEEIVNNLKSNLKPLSRDYYLAPGKNSKVMLGNNDIIKIAEIINDQIFVIYPSLNGIYSYFLEMVQLVIKLGVPLSWVTPNGMEIVQHYLQTKTTNLNINILGRKKFVLKNVTDKINISKQISAFIPNIIHSLDASHLMKVVISSIKGGYYPIITIHDCFGTHPNKIEILSYRVKSEFVLLYSGDNYLNKFHKHIISTLKVNNYKVKQSKSEYFVYFKKNDEWIKLPILPKLGKLDLNLIKQSSYMIT